MNIFKKLFGKKEKTPTQVVEAYKKASIDAADAIDCSAIGKCIGFDERILAWYTTEQEYAKYGFKPIPTEELINYVGWGGKPPTWGEVLTEPAVFYAWNPNDTDKNIKLTGSANDGEFVGTLSYNVGPQESTKHGV